VKDDIGEQVITLCGSTRFKKEFEEVNKRLSLEGKVVLTVAFFGHADNLNLSTADKATLDKVHLRKIDLVQAIYVINVGGYIGESTKREIAYAKQQGKPIYYHEKLNEVDAN
jgi:hypothetical protein